MLNGTKNTLLRLVALAALGLGLGGVLTVGTLDVANAQRRARTSMVEAPQDAPSASGVVNINTATETELGRLPGIGPSKAAAIVAFRARGRQFQRVEDLLRVRGIGRATFRQLRPMLTINGPTTMAAPSGGN
jgi:competence protein ComEA